MNPLTKASLVMFANLEAAWQDRDSSFKRFFLTAGIRALEQMLPEDAEWLAGAQPRHSLATAAARTRKKWLKETDQTSHLAPPLIAALSAKYHLCGSSPRTLKGELMPHSISHGNTCSESDLWILRVALYALAPQLIPLDDQMYS